MNPIDEIVVVRNKARECSDPNVDVCFLATVTSEGGATVRAISLRDVTRQGFGILINNASLKWQQIELKSPVELLIYWPKVSSQYRIRGSFVPMEEDKRCFYWGRKSYGSKLLELYYSAYEKQSGTVPSRQHMLERIEILKAKHPDQEKIPVPKGLKGVYLLPNRIEMWTSGAERLHHRRLYTKDAGTWNEQILVP